MLYLTLTKGPGPAFSSAWCLAAQSEAQLYRRHTSPPNAARFHRGRSEALLGKGSDLQSIGLIFLSHCPWRERGQGHCSLHCVGAEFRARCVVLLEHIAVLTW